MMIEHKIRGGGIMNEQRTFGIELEFKSSANHADVTERINTALRSVAWETGEDHHTAWNYGGYRHDTNQSNRTTWTVKTDASINNDGVMASHPHGVEVVSPILKGSKSFKIIKAVCEAITPIAKITRTCGFHVHHGVLAAELRDIANAWWKVERPIMTLVPSSRRDNRFCQTWQRQFGTRSENYFFNPSVGVDRIRHTFQMTGRYLTLNFCSFWSHGTVEFRVHSGTNDADKVINWVVYTQSVIEKAHVIARSEGQPANEQDIEWAHEIMMQKEYERAPMTTEQYTEMVRENPYRNYSYRSGRRSGSRSRRVSYTVDERRVRDLVLSLMNGSMTTMQINFRILQLFQESTAPGIPRTVEEAHQWHSRAQRQLQREGYTLRAVNRRFWIATPPEAQQVETETHRMVPRTREREVYGHEHVELTDESVEMIAQAIEWARDRQRQFR